MKQEDLEHVMEIAGELKRSQETPDSPEALATIPMLGLNDLDKKNKIIPLAVSVEQESRLLLHDLFTNGIAYVDLGLGLHGLPFAYLPYIPLFGRALTEMGTEKEDFVALTQRISGTTGGVHAHPFSSNKKGSSESASWLFVSGKAMYSQAEDAYGRFQGYSPDREAGQSGAIPANGDGRKGQDGAEDDPRRPSDGQSQT